MSAFMLGERLGQQLWQQGPADTSGYMLLGFAVILGIMAVYIVSLVVRIRSRRVEAAMLEQILQERASGGDDGG